MIRSLIRRHVGVRAEGMILVAAIWALIGVGVVTSPITTPPPPAVWHTLIPTPLLAGGWIATAAAAAVTAPLRRASDVGLLLLTIMPGLLLTSYLYAWIADVWPGDPVGDPRGWYRCLFYVAMVLWVRHISRIPADVQAPLSGRRRR